jgi:hypothetical protein
MARQSAPIQVNQFVGGLNTEANPLNYPANSSYDEVNMELESNGARYQRPGFDAEVDYQDRFTSVARKSDTYLGRSQFRWENPSGYEGSQIIVVQIGNYLGFHRTTSNPLSTERLHYEVFSTAVYPNNFSYAQVDGYLIVATGLPGVIVFEFDGSSAITRYNRELQIRDFFGVEALGDSVTVSDSENWQYRPATLSRHAVYNLRNQTFALPQVEYNANTTAKVDPLERFYDASGNTVWPSHSDSVIPHLWANTSLSSSRTVERYQAADHFAKVPPNERAPMGYFKINALKRGSSRQAQLEKLENDYPELIIRGNRAISFNADLTPSGATQVTSYAGRVWYAGFPSTVVDGDSESPRMGSYLLFSQIVDNLEDVYKCYQEADPTSSEDPDIVASDGGYIKIAGAYNINKLIPMDSSLYVFAENGVWRVRGTEEDVFTATGYSVSKLSEFGCTSSGSVVQYGSEVLFWSDDGIYRLFQDPTLNTYEVKNLTGETIETLYNQITSEERQVWSIH